MRTKNNETKLIQLINGIMNDEIKEEDVYTEDEYYKILIDNNTLIRNTLKLHKEKQKKEAKEHKKQQKEQEKHQKEH